ncbi:hypothetical protein [Cellulomonas cellasea]|uniref:ATP/GTP-binding protein n=1 Tax=Cellulomonas cellasea TaxID=43670 RepID=A0A4Y3L2H1_9CELL|nr:hypothetical protein [Cellulomonas cellasea]GEA89058.1 ATP/GTP-binding protein [Cellulomonas cellasea]
MLTPARGMSTGLLAAFLLCAAATSAESGPAPVCPPTVPTCTVSVERPGTPSAPVAVDAPAPGAPGDRVCVVDLTGETVPCRSAFGWFNDSDDCYYGLLDPQPPGDDPLWQGNYPSGAMYQVSCTGPLPGTNGGWTWLPTPPPGFGGVSVTPAELASRAVDRMQLVGPAIGITVPPDRLGLVGVPVWLWTEVSPTTWGPNSATASVPGLSVTATAQVQEIRWDMGDGNAVVCPNAGTPWYEGGIESPTCDHIYEQPSVGQPDDAYTVTATSTWDVTWSGGGASGSLTLTRSSSTTVRIGELQVLVTG